MSVDQNALMELFMKTVPKTVVAIETAASLRQLFADGLVEFFVGEDQQVRARLIEYQDGQVRVA
jgi:hypothetical protein